MNVSPLILVLSLLVSSCLSTPPCPVVRFNNGKVSGVTRRANYEDANFVFNYNAIPFAEPPVGTQRFKRTTALHRKWSGILDGSTPKNGCLMTNIFAKQYDAVFPTKADHKFTFAEDCLNLNIYTPTVNKSGNLPVIVWIYGGGFQFGNNQQYDGTVLAGIENVVVVVPNYRVNILGFLSFGKKSILPGNVGLHDQLLAFRWVKKNIHNFGGDPNNVLAIGESAGAIAIGHILNSKSFKGLFHKAIQTSGVATTQLTILNDETRRNTNKKLFAMLGLTANDDEGKLRQLQKLDGNELVEVHRSLSMEQVFYYPFFDGPIIKQDPWLALEDGNFNKVPTIIIHNDSEGLGVLNSLIPGYTDGLSESVAETMLRPIFKQFRPNADFDAMYQKVKKFYLKQYPNDKYFYSKLFGRGYGDIYFSYPSLTSGIKLSETSNTTYMGIGAYPLKLFQDPDYSDGMRILPEWVNCGHSNDLMLTFGYPFLNDKLNNNPKFTDEEKVLSLKYMRFIANFARNGNPNDVGSNAWKPFTSSESNIMKIGLNKMTLESNIHQELVNFWSQDFQ